DIVEVARWRANDMATLGYYSHTEPGTNQAASDVKWCGLVPDMVAGLGGFCGNFFESPENIDAGCSDLICAEQAYIVEGSGGSHFQQIISPNDVWIGFGEQYNGKTFDASKYPGPMNYFVEDFVSTF
ncbi:MAG: hypothetical protein M3R35_03440, partial [Candidatus Eremiobacteraeota bacterium]|nr:hypothetical protein [Candidatus Eremiobacteraeota bacterium]